VKRSYRGVRFDRFRNTVIIIVIVTVRQRRRNCKWRNLELDCRRTGRFPLILGRFRLWARCHENRSAKAIPVIDEFLTSQLEERHYEGLCSSNGHDGSGSKLLVTYDSNDTVGVQLANERYLSSTMVSKAIKHEDDRLMITPFVAFHHWMEVPFVSPSRKASSMTRLEGTGAAELDIV